jgi:hypothetical protein
MNQNLIWAMQHENTLMDRYDVSIIPSVYASSLWARRPENQGSVTGREFFIAQSI